MDTTYIDMVAERVLAAKMVERGVRLVDAESSARKHVQAETKTFEEAVWFVQAVVTELERDGVVSGPITA